MSCTGACAALVRPEEFTQLCCAAGGPAGACLRTPQQLRASTTRSVCFRVSAERVLSLTVGGGTVAMWGGTVARW